MDVGCSRQALSGTSTTEDLLASFSRSRLGKHGCLIAQTFESLYMYTVWSYGQFCFERIGIAGDECHRLVIGRPGVKLLDRSRFSEYRVNGYIFCIVSLSDVQWVFLIFLSYENTSTDSFLGSSDIPVTKAKSILQVAVVLKLDVV